MEKSLVFKNLKEFKDFLEEILEKRIINNRGIMPSILSFYLEDIKEEVMYEVGLNGKENIYIENPGIYIENGEELKRIIEKYQL